MVKRMKLFLRYDDSPKTEVPSLRGLEEESALESYTKREAEELTDRLVSLYQEGIQFRKGDMIFQVRPDRKHEIPCPRYSKPVVNCPHYVQYMERGLQEQIGDSLAISCFCGRGGLAKYIDSNYTPGERVITHPKGIKTPEGIVITPEVEVVEITSRGIERQVWSIEKVLNYYHQHRCDLSAFMCMGIYGRRISKQK